MKYTGTLFNTKNIAAIGITAAVYTVLTVALAPFGYGMVQMRISELLCLLTFINPVYGIGIVVGCFLSNLASPYGILDVIVGTFASLLTVICISKTKSLFVATLWPTVFCVFVGALIAYSTGISFFIATITVMAGEFVVVTLIGYPLFKFIIQNEALMRLLRLEQISVN